MSDKAARAREVVALGAVFVEMHAGLDEQAEDGYSLDALLAAGEAAEVPFSVAVAWLLLAEMPAPIQLFGGVFILGGVVFIKWGESRLARRVRSREVVARSEAFAEV